ncbi:imm11 family protein [Shewanella algae]|uniref:imm11 family protein n=1 Tax=Shewanella algae TaxID=38313 RepID=UPI00313F37C4
MYFSLITENYFTSTTSFTCIDNREFLYSTDEFKPTSSLRPIVWQDQESADTSKIGHIIDSGDLSISKDLAEIIMSFDPYGVEFYPSKLTLKNSEVSERYLLAINNVIDVIDEEESDIEVSPYNGDLIIHDLYISEEKLKNTPFNKRVVFRVKGAETAMFFCEEVFNILNCDSSFKDLRMEKVHTDDLAVDI